MRELHLFAGCGGGILAGELLGHQCVGAVELDRYSREVLLARQADGYLPPFPIHDDVRTFDGREWRGRVDLVAGGFPCQDISLAGSGDGLAGERSGLWYEMLRVVGDVAPAYVFVENSWALVRRGLGAVLGGLASFGFDAEWTVLSAAEVGACHRRRRCWILAAHPDRVRQREGRANGRAHAGAQGEVAEGPVAHADRRRRGLLGLEEPAGQQGAQGHEPDGRGAAPAPAADSISRRRPQEGTSVAPGLEAPAADAGRALLEEWKGTQGERALAATRGHRWWPAVGALRRADDGRADTMDRTHRLRALGNAQVPLQAAAAFQVLMSRLQ